ncbi:sugar phosphorylase [Salirhabdus salicampi]|uniref:sugar phosphorylase n=1 Tax=Salirhabdus salicampi TaxID=476102 RepID=UPI0020C2A584|nr:sugar phosphorylase [Salirhabdus salicampi]MCP8617876.1 sugar phosphorylase [Salirhabdus salicampi]
MNITMRKSIEDKLQLLYGDRSEEVYKGIEKVIEKYVNRSSSEKPWVTENDVMLITYGDSIKETGKAPLQTLREFLVKYANDTLTAVHILPFYPYTSDDGFSVTDYREINPDLGSWEDVNELAEHFDLMFDAVINHISKSSEWFQGYLNGDPKYKDYFIEADPSLDYSQVTRPRALPLLTPFETSRGVKHVWTTFSEDQIDLNFKNPDVLLEILDILSMYATNGARFLRLDAIGFMWKKQGTTCMHLEETHALIKLIREVLEISAPGTILITETNVPHKDNISYFGNGYDEAQMVYQFPLPPLTLFSFLTGNARKLSEWAASLEPTTEATSFFNFLSSHDGVGMRPTEGILTSEEKQYMVDKTLESGGQVSYKDNGDGTKSPYELNINYLDALAGLEEDDNVRVDKSLAAHTILLSVIGVPGIYVHSLLGSRNYYKGVEESGINRRINREKLDLDELVKELESDSLRHKIFCNMSDRIKLRRTQKAFSPNASQEVLFLDDRLFSIVRHNEETGDKITVLVNVSNEQVSLSNASIQGKDIISGRNVKGKLVINPYQAMWIQ